MPSLNEFSYQYKLDKNYFIECYEQSIKKPCAKRDYFKAMILILFGGGLLLTHLNSYASWLLIFLGITEGLSVKYKKSWWVLRQMLSKAANSIVSISINEDSIKIDSFYVQQRLCWNNINQIEQTEKGFILWEKKTKYYLSKKFLNEEIVTFIKNKIKNEVKNSTM